MWKRYLFDALFVLVFSLLGSFTAYLVYKRVFHVDYYVVDTGFLISSGVSQRQVYEYLQTHPGIYIDRMCVIYAPPDRDITRRLLDELKR